jgi:hypothetical protein
MNKVEMETKTSVWKDTEACWDKCHCPEMIKRDCPAPKYTFLYCWEIEGTYCKLNDYGAKGDDTSICESCRVYKKYGKEEPIKIKLWGKGINTKLENLIRE